MLKLPLLHEASGPSLAHLWSFDCGSGALRQAGILLDLRHLLHFFEVAHLVVHVVILQDFSEGVVFEGWQLDLVQFVHSFRLPNTVENLPVLLRDNELTHVVAKLEQNDADPATVVPDELVKFP